MYLGQGFGWLDLESAHVDDSRDVGPRVSETEVLVGEHEGHLPLQVPDARLGESEKLVRHRVYTW